ncbi:MAG: WXG100 family type VII secretion target [Bacilli bacterium]|nr:WXG100 family type VII secretion target [Bacilli bacterium]
MILKVRHDELNNVKNSIYKDKDILDGEIENLLKSAETLRGIWQGKDSTAFCNNFVNYANKMKNISITFQNIAHFIEQANKGYEERDEEFAHSLKMEASRYGR